MFLRSVRVPDTVVNMLCRMQISMSASYGTRMMKKAAASMKSAGLDFKGKYFMVEHDNLNFLLGKAQVCLLIHFIA